MKIYVTEYVRSTKVQSSVSLVTENHASLSVDHVQSLIKLPTPPKINLRQKPGSELEFVTLTNQATSTHVTIDGSGVLPGEYTLFLESFNELSDFP